MKIFRAIATLAARLFKSKKIATQIVFFVGGQQVNTISMQVGQSVVLTGAGADTNFNPADLDPSTQMTWNIDQQALGTITPNTGTKTASFLAVAPGSCVVTASDKAAHGPGGVLPVVTGQLGISNSGAPAVATQIVITAAAPTGTPVI
jgi:hypothetical protein